MEFSQSMEMVKVVSPAVVDVMVVTHFSRYAAFPSLPLDINPFSANNQ